ncbi:MAG: hypothetical protein M1370_02925 [Bacteroidetes bacterium]|nr:hypothetical protein [Bacteroidota bacterium]
MTSDQFSSAIGTSFATWQSETIGALTYVNEGSTAGSPGVYDSQNVVGWAKLSPGTLAITYVWYSRATRQILQFDMAFNNYYAWSYTAPASCSGNYCDPGNTNLPDTYDVRDIGTHEAGHTLMLDDLYDAGASALTMYGYGDTAELKKDTLGYGDVLGVHAIYP